MKTLIKSLVPLVLGIAWLHSVPSTIAANDRQQTVDQLRQAASEGRVQLRSIAGLKDSFLRSVTIHQPRVSEAGNVTGAVQFGSLRTDVLLQYVDDDFGQWVLVLKVSDSSLSDFIPSLQNPLFDHVPVESGLILFSAHDAKIEGKKLSDDEYQFYADTFSDREFELYADLGVGLAIATTPSPLSPLGLMLHLTGNHDTQIVLQGKLTLGLEVEAVVNNMGRYQLKSALVPELELSAELPDVTVGGLPPSFKTARGKLIVSTEPSIAVAFGMTFAEGTDNSRDFNCKIQLSGGDAKDEQGQEIAKKEISIFAETESDEPWQNAFGIDGFDLQAVRLLVTANNLQQVGIGMGAEMLLGDRRVEVAGKLSFHTVTGAPTGDFFSGKIDRITSSELVAFVNAGRPARTQLGESGVPAFELRDVELTVAPFTGSRELKVERGIVLKGELHSMGQQLAHADVLVDLFTLTPRIRVDAEARDVDLGIVELRDANIDVLLATGGTKNRFLVKGYARVLGDSRLIDVHVSDRRMYYRINDKLAGVFETDMEMLADTSRRPEWYASGTFRNDFSDGLGQSVSRDLLAWANEVDRDSQTARRDLEAAQRDVRRLNRLVDAARQEVEADREQHMRNIRAAEREVARINEGIASRRNVINSARRREVSSLRSTMNRKKRSWESAKRATSSANIFDKPRRKAIEAAKFADYQATRGHYQALVASHRRVPVDADPAIVGLIASRATANATLQGVREASKGVFRVSVDADPRVAGLITARESALAGLRIASASVEGYSAVAGTSAKILAAGARGEVFTVDSASFRTRLALLEGGSLTIELNVRVAGERKKLRLATTTDALKSGQFFGQVATAMTPRS